MDYLADHIDGINWGLFLDYQQYYVNEIRADYYTEEEQMEMFFDLPDFPFFIHTSYRNQ